MTTTAMLNANRASPILEQDAVDGLLAASFENVYYLTGLWSESYFMMPQQTQLYAVAAADRLDAPSVVCSVGEAANIFESCGADVAAYLFGSFFRAVDSGAALTETEEFVRARVVDGRPFATILEATVAAIKDAGLAQATIAYDERAIFPENLALLESRLPDARLVRGWSLFRRIRAAKTEKELEQLQAALALNERAVLAAMGVARPQITEQEMIDEFERTIASGGGRSTFTQIYFGRRGAMGDVRDHRAHLDPRDVIRFDVGCVVDGYHSDIARNFSLQEPEARTRALYDALLHGQEVAAAALRPGVTAREVFNAGVNAVREAGILGYERNHVGHGIGLELYDLPTLSPGEETLIEAGMVFEVETPYYELGFAGLQPEDTVLVTEQGGKFLNGISRDFEVWRP